MARPIAKKKTAVRKKRATRRVAKPKRTASAAAAKRKRSQKSAREEAPVRPSAPSPRRAIFVDVENTSSEVDLLRVIESLHIDRAAQPTDLMAAGNWRSVGQRLARRLAGLGAKLVHSAPAIGVRDWSDLWIAVAAGHWLGRAEAGDQLEILSDDRAFDAVGDLAATLGVKFQRISYRTHQAVPAEPSVVGETTSRPGRRGGRRRRHRPAPQQATPRSAGPAAHATAADASAPGSSLAAHAPAQEEAHPASHAQITSVINRLTGGHRERWVNLDVLANALKADGFVRPPGSPRLVTRLRKLKDVEVSPNGMVRLSGFSEGETAAELAAETPLPRRRPRRRGGRGRRPAPQGADTESQASVIAGGGHESSVP
jgi:hypothetical protein